MNPVILTEVMSHVRSTFMAWSDYLSDERNAQLIGELHEGAALALEVTANPEPYNWFQPRIRIYLHKGNERVMLDEFSAETIN